MKFFFDGRTRMQPYPYQSLLVYKIGGGRGCLLIYIDSLIFSPFYPLPFHLFADDWKQVADHLRLTVACWSTLRSSGLDKFSSHIPTFASRANLVVLFVAFVVRRMIYGVSGSAMSR
jgi:hypothetical protein